MTAHYINKVISADCAAKKYLLCAGEAVTTNDASHVFSLLHLRIRLQHPVESGHVQLQDVL